MGELMVTIAALARVENPRRMGSPPDSSSQSVAAFQIGISSLDVGAFGGDLIGIHRPFLGHYRRDGIGSWRCPSADVPRVLLVAGSSNSGQELMADRSVVGSGALVWGGILNVGVGIMIGLTLPARSGCSCHRADAIIQTTAPS